MGEFHQEIPRLKKKLETEESLSKQFAEEAQVFEQAWLREREVLESWRKVQAQRKVGYTVLWPLLHTMKSLLFKGSAAYHLCESMIAAIKQVVEVHGWEFPPLELPDLKHEHQLKEALGKKTAKPPIVEPTNPADPVMVHNRRRVEGRSVVGDQSPPVQGSG